MSKLKNKKVPKKSTAKASKKPKPKGAFAKKSILPKDIGDIMLNQQPKKTKKKKSDSLLFPDETAARMGNLFKKNGIDAFQNTFSRMSVGNLNSPFALPAMGDISLLPAAGAHSGLSLQASKLDIKGNLKVEGANVTGVMPFYHTPGNAQDAYNLPKSYVEQIRWSRLMYNLNPYIHSITDLKAFYPYSKFKLTTPEPWVTQFYDSVSFNKKFNLYRFILRMSLSLKKFGEAIVWGGRKQDGVWPQTGQPRWIWDYFILLEPELVEIKKDMMGSDQPRYFMRPNRDLEELVKKLKNHDPEVEHLQGKIAQPIMNKIEKRQLIPLDETTISAIQYITDGSAPRGTPPYQSLFVNFIFEDFVRLALMAQANRYHFPIELWLLGNIEKGYMPSVPDLERLRDLVTNAIQNPPFSIFFPPILDYKALGVQGSLMNIKDDMEYAHKQYLIGMGVNENMILGESGIFSNNETAGNQAFIRLMEKDRDEMEEWMRWHFFEPLAQWNNLKINKNGILQPIIPDIEWRKTLDFKSEEDSRERDKYLYEQKLLDPESFISSYGNRNPEDIKIKIQKAIGGVFDDGKIGGEYRKNVKNAGATGEDGGATTEAPDTPVEAPGGTESGGAGGGPGLAPSTESKPEGGETAPEKNAPEPAGGAEETPSGVEGK